MQHVNTKQILRVLKFAKAFDNTSRRKIRKGSRALVNQLYTKCLQTHSLNFPVKYLDALSEFLAICNMNIFGLNV